MTNKHTKRYSISLGAGGMKIETLVSSHYICTITFKTNNIKSWQRCGTSETHKLVVGV